MTSKTIKISEENYKWLLQIAAELQKRREQIVTFDIALSELRGEKMKNKKLSDLAGRWRMSDEEWKRIKKDLKRGWRGWKIPSV